MWVDYRPLHKEVLDRSATIATTPMQLPKPSFVIVVSEKGGSERRVSFTTNVVNIGRVQGNELTLNKTNVSKQHAKLTYRDGVFTVADLHSTNGTYVNKRRIQEATRLNEGDRLFIGDYVIKIESVDHPPPLSDSEVPVEIVDVSASSNAPADSTTTRGKMPHEVGLLSRGDSVSRIAAYPEVPSAPKVPNAGANASPSWSEGSTGRHTVSTEELQQAARASVSEPAIGGGAIATLIPAERDTSSLLASLVESVIEALGERWSGGAVDLEQQSIVERLIEEQLQRLVQAGNVAASVQLERLRVLCRLEVLGLGALQKSLEDPQVTEVLVPRYDQVWVRRSATLEAIEQGLSSRRSLRRIIYRLCIKSGKPVLANETVIERVLPGGGVLWAVLPPHAPGQPSLVFRKSRELPTSIQSLVRVGVVSRAMSLFLQQSVTGRGRVLVVGPRDAEISVVTGALLSSVNDGPLALLEGSTELGVPHSQGPCFRWSLIGASDPRALVFAAARATNTQLGIVLENSASTAALVDVLGGVSVGVVALREGRSIESTLVQLTAEMMTFHRGLSVEAARRAIASSFDLVLEVVRYRDGRQRVIRVVEIGRVSSDEIEIEDIFNFVTSSGTAGDVVEGTFRSTGVVPKFVEELLARGSPFDTNVFSRPAAR
jgi:pilus assembly protein CpaF